MLHDAHNQFGGTDLGFAQASKNTIAFGENETMELRHICNIFEILFNNPYLVENTPNPFNTVNFFSHCTTTFDIMFCAYGNTLKKDMKFI